MSSLDRIPLALALAAASLACAPRATLRGEAEGWEAQARRVTIARDDWGIPHVHGRSDADAVFGLVYAQAEDDFARVESNVLKGLGRTAEAEGEGRLYEDLRMRLIVDPAAMQALYRTSPAWLQSLLEGWAGGLNYFLATHPAVKPRVLTRFEPWMALPFSEGSISWDIERNVSLEALEALYGAGRPLARLEREDLAPPDAGGSNGFAIAPARTAGGHALLLINPHTTFFFRAEAQVESDEGLDAYGAVTWGQCFIYQGFNERLGWMHTSSNADVVDEYAEVVEARDGGLAYRYGDGWRPVEAQPVTLRYRTAAGSAERTFTIYRTHHGPIVRRAEGRFIAVRLMQEPVKALSEAFLTTKARTFEDYRALLDLQANSSNNTVYADADGNVAFFLANFLPRRDPALDWTRPVDGSDPATEWQGLHPVDTLPNLRNPAGGWLQNTNDWPWTAAGPDSPWAQDYPAYMDLQGENARGVHAVRLLSTRTGLTLDGLVEAAFDPALPAFDVLLPPLLAAWEAEPEESPLRELLRAQVAALRGWDRRWGAASTPTTLAIAWATELQRRSRDGAGWRRWSALVQAAADRTPRELLEALAAASEGLRSGFGTWEVPWGELNRFQRPAGGPAAPFDDARPSTPVPFASATWGSLAAFEVQRPKGARRQYGVRGNSFVAVVEFGPRVRARAVTTGGQSGDPASPHYADQAERYAGGALRDVYFYRDDLERHLVREYHPGR